MNINWNRPGHHPLKKTSAAQAASSRYCQTKTFTRAKPVHFSFTRACGGHVNGFYYACAKIGHYYHTLCLALPLSIAVSSHTHKLKLAYSSPYDFCCDICTKPGYKIRWLYRCQICEYDTHLSCVISNGKEQFSLQHSITPFPNTSTTRQSSYFSTALAGIDRPLDYIGEANELMQLVTQAVVVAGGDYQGLQCQRPSPSTPGSEDLSINPSYQFSDACFSIDLERSYSNYNQANIQAINHQVAKTNIPEVHGANFRHVNTGIPNMKLMKQPSFANGTTTIYPLNVGPAEGNRMKEAFLIRSGSALACDELVQKEKMKRKAKENKLKLGPGNDQITKSDADMSSRSSWQNLLSCCYYNPKA
ncbi:hypothetical protein FEM48_Zijuj12G0084500 [Ziziphus jujuba var. spinosa]|uniref:DC1 domain-containing protein n=1 Tax=Ziziphus jujuba var. spinosa TaxID=714518 RepID=A0A978UC84_ZIZJJ|nr:hypothetical protein FEM48_Zijuj12G0084500 [Ziziphus jujuba var. spinosa]